MPAEAMARATRSFRVVVVVVTLFVTKNRRKKYKDEHRRYIHRVSEKTGPFVIS